MNDYRPRRCSKRWLDGDCPREVLAIMDHPKESDRYTIFYWFNLPLDVAEGRHTEIEFISIDECGRYYHDSMEAYKVASYRYREKHHYAKWSDLPEAVKAVVRRDLEQ